MAKLKGAFVSMAFKEITEFQWTNPKTNEIVPIKKIIGIMEFEEDGKRDAVEIGFPKDPKFRPPQLEPKTLYVFPVLMSVGRKKSDLQLTLRTDTPIFPTPDLA